MQKNRYLKDSPLELEEDFEELRDRDLKDREKKLKERQENYFVSLKNKS